MMHTTTLAPPQLLVIQHRCRPQRIFQHFPLRKLHREAWLWAPARVVVQGEAGLGLVLRTFRPFPKRTPTQQDREQGTRGWILAVCPPLFTLPRFSNKWSKTKRLANMKSGLEKTKPRPYVYR